MFGEFIKTYHNKSSLYINDQQKWLWLRIHKNAGTSIYDALEGYCINEPKWLPEKAVKWVENATDELVSKYFIWSVVRNPYDRFVSMAHMFSCEPNRFAREFDELRCVKGIIKRHTEPQHIYTHYNGIDMCDMTIKVETIASQWPKICFEIKVPETNLKWLNKTEHRHWVHELDMKSIDFINKRFELDFLRFDYDFA